MLQIQNVETKDPRVTTGGNEISCQPRLEERRANSTSVHAVAVTLCRGPVERLMRAAAPHAPWRRSSLRAADGCGLSVRSTQTDDRAPSIETGPCPAEPAASERRGGGVPTSMVPRVPVFILAAVAMVTSGTAITATAAYAASSSSHGLDRHGGHGQSRDE